MGNAEVILHINFAGKGAFARFRRILPMKFTDGTSNWQNNFQYGAGIIFRFSAQ